MYLTCTVYLAAIHSKHLQRRDSNSALHAVLACSVRAAPDLMF